MKKILITGANSYIGVSFEEYLKQFDGEYLVDTVDMIDEGWREKDFSAYDTVFHVAGIAHIKETDENANLYYKVNRDLAIDTAKKAKNAGVKHFIFLSTMSVYGMDEGVITPKTMPSPSSNYGKSKLQAEEEINKLSDKAFCVSVVRPPMVYGKDCKGNFQTVLKLVSKLPFFPKVSNKRSMIYIDNLSSFIKFIIDNKYEGLFMPQNEEYMNTSLMAKYLADTLDKKLFVSKLLGFAVVIFRPFLKILQKAFGTLIYKDTEVFEFKYCVINNEDSVRKSV